MPVFWGNRKRHRNHDHHEPRTHVTTTSGARVIDTRRGRGRSVVAVPTTNVSTYVTANNRNDRRYRSRSSRRPSTMRGLWNKFLGALTGNRSRRRRGERELRRVREEKMAMGTVRRARGIRHGAINKLRKFRPRRHNKKSHRHDGGPVVVAQDRSRRHGKTPWGHHSGRTLPPYHGAHHRILGFFTGHSDRTARGRAMALAAEEERMRERRRRKDELRDQGRRYRSRGAWI